MDLTAGRKWRPVSTTASAGRCDRLRGPLDEGMSRAVFAERFTALLGRTSRQYLTAWRMNLADEMLRTGGQRVNNHP